MLKCGQVNLKEGHGRDETVGKRWARKCLRTKLHSVITDMYRV